VTNFEISDSAKPQTVTSLSGVFVSKIYTTIRNVKRTDDAFDEKGEALGVGG